MKKTVAISVLMAAILLMSAGWSLSESTAQFTFMDAITWDSTPEDVASILGEGVQRADGNDESTGTITILRKDNSDFVGFKCSIMAFAYNNNLFSIACYYTEANVASPDALIEGLTEIYGAPKKYASNIVSLEDLMCETKALGKWTIGHDTAIEAMQLYAESCIWPKREEAPYSYIVSFKNIPVEKQMEEAILKVYGN